MISTQRKDVLKSMNSDYQLPCLLIFTGFFGDVVCLRSKRPVVRIHSGAPKQKHLRVPAPLEAAKNTRFRTDSDNQLTPTAGPGTRFLPLSLVAQVVQP
jgi:hypothetical protein